MNKEVNFKIKEMLDDMYNSQIDNLDEIILKKEKEIKNMVEVDEEKIRIFMIKNLDKENQEKLKKVFYDIEEKNNIKLSEYSREMYKQGIIDGVNFILNCLNTN